MKEILLFTASCFLFVYVDQHNMRFLEITPEPARLSLYKEKIFESRTFTVLLKNIT